MSIKDMGASYAPSLMGFVKQAMGTRRAQQLSIAEADVGIIVLVDFACTGSIKDHAALWLLFGTDVVGRRAPMFAHCTIRQSSSTFNIVSVLSH
jgi:hypothetical protein